MSGFDADWLALRRPFDMAARAAADELVRRFAEALGSGPLVVDLAGGTGNNVRFLAPRIAGRWRIVDHEPALLAMAEAHCGGIDIETVVADLAAAPWPAVLTGARGVATAAFLDLVSEAWLAGLVDAMAVQRLPVLAALTFDGRLAWTPGHSDDGVISAAFLADLRRDKGFEPSAGAAAAEVFAAQLMAAGYDVTAAATDWAVGPGETDMLTAMVTGIAGAAGRQGVDGGLVGGWREARLAAIEAGALRLMVGHQDVLGLI